MEILNYNNCEGILLRDPLIIEWLEAPIKPNLTFKIKKDCKDLVEIEMRPNLYNQEAMGAVLTPEDLAQVGLIEDAIYSVTIKQLEEQGGVQKDNCTLIDCNIKCRVLDFVSQNLDSPVGIYYETLKYINSCATCSCETGCKLWEEIKKILDKTKPKPCGNCS